MNDEYIKVQGQFVFKGRDAALINPNHAGRDNECWIPFSLMHGADERKFSIDKFDTMIEFRLRKWKALSFGFKEI